MMSHKMGPLLSDREFFKECLNYNYPGMEEVKRAAENNDYTTARKHFANHIRISLRPEVFFKIPIEVLEMTHTYPNETVEEAANRLVERRLISCGIAHDFGEVVDWFANPTYNQYREWTWQLNRHSDWKALAYVYRETGDEKYAEACAQLFNSWVKQAVRPDEDADGFETHCWRTIECGIRMGCNWPYVLHAFCQSTAFSDDIITDWFKSIVEHGRRLSKRYKKGNWLIIEMNGLAHIGILYPQLKDSKIWLDFAFNKLQEELDKQIYPDGFQYELATGYHDGVLSNYQRLFLTSKAYGVEFPPDFITILERMALVDVKLMQPDGRLPNINDGSSLEVSKVLTSRLEMFPDNREILWAATGGTRGKVPEYTSVALPYSGFTIMRSGWTSDDSWVFFDGGLFGRAHQHEDKLSLLYFTAGKLILTEAGNYAYDDSEMREYVLSTRGHNTIRINGMDQNRRTGYSFEEREINQKADIAYHFSSQCDYAEASYTEGYGPLQEKLAKHSRSVYFIKRPICDMRPLLLVVDRLESGEEQEYEAIWHFDTESVEVVPGSDKKPGIAVMKELSVFVSPGTMELSVAKGQHEPELQGYVANSAIQGDYRPIPVLLAKKKASNLRLVTVLVPNQNGSSLIHRVKASSCIEDTKISLYLADGTIWEIDEEDMKNG